MKGLWKINDIDIFEVYGVAILKGSYNDIISPPTPRKRLEYEYKDRNGTEVDTNTPLSYEAKRYKLKCAIYANSSVQFWSRYNAFIALVAQAGSFDLSIAEIDKTITILYEGATVTKKITRIKNCDMIAIEFDLSVFEPMTATTAASNPDLVIVDNQNIYIVNTPSGIIQTINQKTYLTVEDSTIQAGNLALVADGQYNGIDNPSLIFKQIDNQLFLNTEL